MTDKEKTIELLKLIDDLCDVDFSKRNDIDERVNRLNRVYSNGYRHTYSDIFSKIQQIMSETMSSNPVKDTETLETLGENLNELGRRINELAAKNSDDANYQNTVSGYRKFSDHIRLEIGRYNFIKSRFTNPSQGGASGNSTDVPYGGDQPQMRKLSEDINAMRPTIAQAQKQLDGLDDKLERNKISSITTLTIFSAVILAFSGGITFESAILKGMAEPTSYRLVFTIALSGFILFNTIFALLYLVGKMAGRQISTRCKFLSTNEVDHKHCQPCGDGYCMKECPEVTIVCRILHKYSYVLATNSVLLYVLYSVFFLWLSKGNLCEPEFYLSQVMLFVLLVSCVILSYIRKYNRLKRIKLHYRVFLLKSLIESKQPYYSSSNLENLSDDEAFCGLLEEGKSISFWDKLPFVNKFKFLRRFNRFADGYIVSNSGLSIFVARTEHKINRRAWRQLNKRLNCFLKSNSCNAAKSTDNKQSATN